MDLLFKVTYKYVHTHARAQTHIHTHTHTMIEHIHASVIEIFIAHLDCVS